MRKLILAATLLLAACSGGDTFSNPTGPETLASKPSSSAPSVSIADVTCAESVGLCTLTITKGRAKSYSKISVTTIDGTARAGSDYTAINQQLTMGNNTTSATVTVPITDDTAIEGAEQFQVIVKSIRNAVIARSPATVTITDNDTATPAPATPTFSIADVMVNEDAGTAILTVTKTGTNGSSSSLTYATANGTATAGSDYTAASGTLTFADADMSKTFTVPITDDASVESSETFFASVTSVTNASVTRSRATVTVMDNDTPTGSTSSGGWVTSPSLTGLTPIASEFDYTLGLIPSPLPGSAAGDQEGAFRFMCGSGQILYDDPLVFPGQPGKSHLHEFYGNTGANAYSTYESLRTSGSSTCAYGAYPLNRSAYWAPAILDGKGHVVNPDFIEIYYKRRPATDPIVSDPTAKFYEGQAVALPNGLRFIFGWDPTGQHLTPTGSAIMMCIYAAGGSSAAYTTFAQVAAVCPAGVGNQLEYSIFAPSCWDGKNLDSPDHRTHVGYATYGSWGYLKCDAQHPYVIPQFTLKWFTSVAAGDDVSKWSFSSDAMAPDKPAGYTLHADFFMAWDANALGLWMDNCIDKEMSCSSGNLGEGHRVLGSGPPDYGWVNPNHLVPIP
jgi:hypothetical protein